MIDFTSLQYQIKHPSLERNRQLVRRLADTHMPPAASSSPLAWWKYAVIVMLLFLLIPAGSASAARSRPGHWAYPIKRGIEKVQQIVALTPGQKQRLALKLSQERLKEAWISQNQEQLEQVADQVLTEAEQNLDQALPLLNKQPDKKAKIITRLDQLEQKTDSPQLKTKIKRIKQRLMAGDTGLPSPTPSLMPSLPPDIKPSLTPSLPSDVSATPIPSQILPSLTPHPTLVVGKPSPVLPTGYPTPFYITPAPRPSEPATPSPRISPTPTPTPASPTSTPTATAYPTLQVLPAEDELIAPLPTQIIVDQPEIDGQQSLENQQTSR